jgi:diguanylate cyclase (GGDEF)-like protein
MTPALQRQRWRYTQVTVVTLLVLVLLVGGVYLGKIGRQLQNNTDLDHTAQAFMIAMIDGETAVRGFVVTGSPVFLEPYTDSFSNANTLLNRLLALMPPRIEKDFDEGHLISLVRARQASLATTIQLRRDKGFEAAQAYVAGFEGKMQMDEIRKQIAAVAAIVERESQSLNRQLTFSLTFITPAVAILTLTMLVLAAVQVRLMQRTMRAARDAEAEAERRSLQLAALSDMADELHAAADRDETYAIIRHHGARLLPAQSVALFVYNHSRDQLRRVAEWGGGTEHLSAEIFAPSDCWSIRKGKPQLNHPERGVQCAHILNHDRATLCVPITARGQTVGLLCVGEVGLEAIEEGGEVRRVAMTLGEQVALALVNLDLRERLENQALRDTLTNLYNRRYLEEASERELSRAERLGAPLSVLAIDIDHFKRFNDQHGHAAGDEVLKHVAAHLQDGSRSTDLVCRLGGEELLIVLPDTDTEGAVEIAEKLRGEVGHLRIRWQNGELPPVTISIGVASYPAHARKFGVLQNLADEALYRAKQDGRNCVRVWRERTRATA